MHDMGIISKIKSKLSYKEVTPLYMDDLLRDAYQTTSVVGGSLKGRIALVTGATSGIGFAIAERLLGEGCRVIISGRNVQKLQTAVAELKRRSCKANDDTLSTLLLNQYDAEAVRNSVDGLFSTAPVSIVINNACGFSRNHYYTPYGISKTGVIRFTEQLSAAYKGRGVIVNSIAPGSVATAMNHSRMNDNIASFHPLNHIIFSEQIAALAAFMIGNVSKFQVGEVKKACATENV